MADDLDMLLLRRAATLGSHAGQIAIPGGVGAKHLCRLSSSDEMDASAADIDALLGRHLMDDGVIIQSGPPE